MTSDEVATITMSPSPPSGKPDVPIRAYPTTPKLSDINLNPLQPALSTLPLIPTGKLSSILIRLSMNFQQSWTTAHKYHSWDSKVLYCNKVRSQDNSYIMSGILAVIIMFLFFSSHNESIPYSQMVEQNDFWYMLELRLHVTFPP